MLPTYKKILLATDFSTNCKQSFKHAVVLARQNDADICMLHVIPELDSRLSSFMHNMMATGQYETLLEDHQKQALNETRAELGRFAAEELSNHPKDLERFTDFKVTHGPAAQKILSIAEEWQADMIVMGARAKGPFEHSLIGSVTQQVLHRSTKPVTVVPLKTEPPQTVID